MDHPKRNEINKALGFGGQSLLADDYIETGQSPFLPGDVLLLCSDGLTDLVNKAEITATLTTSSSLKEKANSLITAANNKGGKDNITVVLVQNEKKPLKQKATKPPITVKKNIHQKTQLKSVEQEQTLPDVGERISLAKQKSRGGVISFLIILCVGLGAALLWMLWQNSREENAFAEAQITSRESVKNAQEIKLQQAIDAMAGNTLILSDSVFTQPIIISDTLLIQKDSLYIKVQGNIILKSDSIYAGLALFISPQCKYIVLEGLVFSDFAVAISTNNNVLHLNNVRFINCSTPLQASFSIPNNVFVNGTIQGSFFTTDSLPKLLIK
jgi:hypothetical protein